jgi:hypothetical protein
MGREPECPTAVLRLWHRAPASLLVVCERSLNVAVWTVLAYIPIPIPIPIPVPIPIPIPIPCVIAQSRTGFPMFRRVGPGARPFPSRRQILTPSGCSVRPARYVQVNHFPFPGSPFTVHRPPFTVHGSRCRFQCIGRTKTHSGGSRERRAI